MEGHAIYGVVYDEAYRLIPETGSGPPGRPQHVQDRQDQAILSEARSR